MRRAAGLGIAIVALALALDAPGYAAPSAAALATYVVGVRGGGHGGGGGHFRGGGGHFRGGGHHHGGGHFRGGVTFGLGIGPWWGYPYPFYYYPPYPSSTVIIRQSPAVEYYEEEAAPVAPSGRHWYFCRESNAYYPYVRRCPDGWEKVPAIPPADGEEY